jgi:hypothetical protein
VASNWTAEAERVVAWMRLPAIVLLAYGEGLEHPNPQRTGFVITLAAFSAWSAGVLAWVHIRDASPRFALAATAVDIVAISGLAMLSGARSRTRVSRSSSSRSPLRFAFGPRSPPRRRWSRRPHT